jgi:hypothetical protein
MWRAVFGNFVLPKDTRKIEGQEAGKQEAEPRKVGNWVFGDGSVVLGAKEKAKEGVRLGHCGARVAGFWGRG